MPLEIDFASPLAHETAASAARAVDVTYVHERYAGLVWSLLQRFGVPLSDLEDGLQEVFVVVHRKLATLTHPDALPSWLYGISLRVAKDFRRRAHRRRETLCDDVPAQEASRDPEASCVARQAERRLGEVLSAMDLEKRAVFVMFEIDEVDCAEIARLMGVPLGTVYSRLHTARCEFTKIAARLDARDARRTR